MELTQCTSIYTGVNWNKLLKKWMVQITIDGKQKYLGCFKDEKEGARAYDDCVRNNPTIKIKKVNFPNNPNEIQPIKQKTGKYNPNEKIFTTLLDGMKVSSKTRNHNPPEWSLELIIRRLQETEYICFISGCKMRPEDITPERINEKIGYTLENTQFMHIAFQSTGNHAQWTPEKFNKVPILQDTSSSWFKEDNIKAIKKHRNEECTSNFVGVNRGKANKKWIVKISINGKDKHLGCFHDEKDAARAYDEQATLLNRPVNFPQHEDQQKAKKQIKHYNNKCVIYDTILALYGHASTRYKENSKKICTLTFNDILDMYINQKGRCYYLNIPLSMDTCSEWRCSLERLDDDKGYTKNNCVLVCHEVNHGLYKWSRELASRFWP
jgi:hypothetical protein